jgi:hypothetical protein
VTAIFKKGKKTLPNNYRPVSLTSVVCKLLETIVRDHLVEHFKKNNLFSPKQFGFLPGRSTSLQLLHVLDIWSDILDQGGTLDAIYCDFMKAFDKVPHNRLLHKISKYGISHNITNWIRSFLSGRTQCVSINNSISKSAPVTSGIPQGSVLGPILFVIYINDLPDVIDKDTHIYLFADDTKLFRKINSDLDKHILQKDINNLVEWSNIWLLRFHPDKCVSMTIGSEHKSLYYMSSHPLNISHCEKDIGVYIDDELSFDIHINNIINKSNRILAICKRTFDFLNVQTFSLIFKGLIRPHLEYASSVWSPHLSRQITALEKVQKRATKLVHGLSPLPYNERLKILKLPTLKYRRTRGDMINLFKLTCDEGGFDNTLPTLITYNHTNLRGHNKKLFLPRKLKDIGKYSFNSRTINIWNSLPQHVINAKDTLQFEIRLDHFWQDQDFLHDYKADVIC